MDLFDRTAATGSPEKVRAAAEISKRIDETFERIHSFHERPGTGRH